MLLGAHVSPAGGLINAVLRGEQRGCDAIQIFNQSPRMWRPTAYTDDDFAAFRNAMRESRLQAVVIHAVYLINTASEDPALRANSLASLTHSLRVGAAIGARGVIVHAGSAKSGPVDQALARSGEVIAQALADSEGCDLHLEDTAGAGGTLGRSFEEIAALIDAAGADQRLGMCLDSCHLYASGYDIRTAESLSSVLDEADTVVGLDRLRSLHVNDSIAGLASNRDRHAALGAGELGDEGIAAFLSEPRFDGLPVIFEGPGIGGKQVEREDMEIARRLRALGLESRRG